MNKPDIFVNQMFHHPAYQHLEKYVDIMYDGMWTPKEYKDRIESEDVHQVKYQLPEVDQEFIRRVILGIGMVENKVKTFWPKVADMFPQTIIGDIAGLFGQSEVTHRRAYEGLIQSLKIDESLAYEVPVLRSRLDYLQKYLQKDPAFNDRQHVLKTLCLFTAFTEKGSLNHHFYALMSYAHNKRGLVTMSTLQEVTATEEMTHYQFGLDLVNIIKEQSPALWTDYMEELVKKRFFDAYNTETRMIDWFCEEGVPEHLTVQELKNFLNYQFNQISEDFGLQITLPFDEELFERKSNFFNSQVKNKTQADFFVTKTGGYSHQRQKVNLTDFKNRFKKS